MKKYLQKKLNNEKGMTLIELLAVIVIIAIISAIAIPAIAGIIENSRVGAIKSDAINVINSAKIYQADTNDTTVTLVQLESGGYIEDAGTFEELSPEDKALVKVEFTGGNALLSGENFDDGIVLTFATADIAAINALANGTDVSGTSTAGVGNGSVTVTKR